MSFFRNKHKCIECECSIDEKVFQYSVGYFQFPLCRDCQKWLVNISERATKESIFLYFALRERSVPAELEKFDGSKVIDIAVVEAKVNIEVDGGQHNYSAKQALADLKRTYYSFKKGYFTLRIPNSLVRNHLDETADLITEILNIHESKQHHKARKWWQW